MRLVTLEGKTIGRLNATMIRKVNGISAEDGTTCLLQKKLQKTLRLLS